jgi:aminopeptidase N
MAAAAIFSGVLAFCVAATQAGAAPAEIIDSQTPDLEIGSYALKIAVDPDAKTIDGKVTIDLRYANHGARQARLDLSPEMNVRSVAVDGSAVAYSRDGDLLVVPLPAADRVNGKIVGHSIAVDYAGTPLPRYFSFEALNGSAAAASYGLPMSARHWWPCFDSPRLKAREADIQITVPRNLTAAANGTLIGVSHENEATSTYHWHEKYPICADVVSVAAAAYTKFSLDYTGKSGTPLPLEFYVSTQTLEHAKADFSVVPQVLGSYEEILGPYPFAGEKYGIAEFSRGSFREHQTLPSLGSKFITGVNENWWIIAHEIAHQWFGNSLSVGNWSDIWLNESFSQYAVALWQERKGGAAAYRAFLATLWKADFTGSIYVEDPTKFDRMFGDTMFGKGPWVLHTLRHVMGDAAFFRALKAYIAENRYGRVSTAAWQSICERTYGKPLGWFFDEWVRGVGQPSFRVDWARQDAAGKTGASYALRVTQTQAGAVFEMPVDFLIHTGNGTVATTAWINSRSQVIAIDAPADIVSVEIDPGDWILKGTVSN